MLRSVVFAAIFFSILPFVFRRPWVGVLVMLWLGYMNPHRFCYGFAYLFPWTMIATLVTVFAVIGSGEIRKLPWTREVTVLALLILWMNVTTLFAFNKHPLWGAPAEWDRVMKIQALVFLMMMMMRDKWRLQAAIWTIVLSLGFFGFKGGLWTILTGGSNRVQGPENTFIVDNNCLALALVMILPYIRYLQLNTGHKMVKLAMTILMGLTVVAIAGTYSRGGLIGLTAVGLGLIWKSRRRFMLIALCCILALIVVNVMPEQWQQRMRGMKEYEQDDSVTGRFNAWWFAWNLAKDRPLVGGGFRTFTWDLFEIYAPDPRAHHDAHSIYFKMLAEHGFPGLGLFLLLGFLTWRSASWVKKTAADHPTMQWAGDLSAMSQVSLIGFMTGGAFVGLAYFDLPYHVMAIIVLCKYMMRQHLLEATYSTPEPQPESHLAPQEALA